MDGLPRAEECIMTTSIRPWLISLLEVLCQPHIVFLAYSIAYERTIGPLLHLERQYRLTNLGRSHFSIEENLCNDPAQNHLVGYECTRVLPQDNTPSKIVS